MKRLLSLLLALLVISSASSQTVLESTVPGDRLGWETDELNVVISLLEETELKLEVYSPAFDPDDYRASLEGLPELGDERYDGGEGELQSHFTLSRGDTVLFERSYGIAPHGTDVLFEGTLPAGEYRLNSSFEGLGKNAFLYTLEANPAAAIYFDADATMLFNIRGQELQPVMTVHVTDRDTPADFWIYDGDGYEELRGRLDTPSGPLELPISGDLEWSRVRLGQPGTYTFSFYQPEGAYQHSNTIGIRTDARLRSTPEGLEFTRKAPVRVEIIDTDGYPIAGEYVIDEEGDIRTAILTSLPEGYTLVDTRTEGGVIEDPEHVRFGPAGGVATFVAEKEAAAPALLTVSASLEYPGVDEPWPLEFLLDGEAHTLPESGTATFEVDPALHVVRAVAIPGATVTEQAYNIPIRSGDHESVHFVVRPVVNLGLTVDPDLRYVGEEVLFTATATTQFAELLPGDLELVLPEGLQPEGDLTLSGDFSAGQPLVLEVPATGLEPGDYTGTATLAPWELQRSVPVTVIAPEPEPEPAPAPEPEPAPAPEPEVLPEPERELPDFAMSRMSTVYVDFQADELARCELPVLEPGEGVTLGVALHVPERDLWAPNDVQPAASPADSLQAYIQEAELFEDGGRLNVYVRNYGDGTVTDGSILVGLPGGSVLAGANCEPAAGTGSELLVSHSMPEGGTYLPGSAELDGKPFEEPLEADGELLWRLPWQEQGTISYGVSHEDALGVLTEPALTVLLGDREHRIRGDLGAGAFDAAEATESGLIAAPKAGSTFVTEDGAVLALRSSEPVTIRVNGLKVDAEGELGEDGLVYVPVDLEPGSNLISADSGLNSESILVHGADQPVELSIEPVRLIADGRSNLLVDIVARDADGVAVGSGPVSIGANTQPAGEDADENISGWQVDLENGRARLELEPAAAPFDLEVTAGYGRLETQENLRVLGTESNLYQAMVSVTARVTGGFAIDGVARGYVETQLGDGTLPAAADVAADMSGLDLERGLAQSPDPTDRFPLTGAGTEARPALKSSDGFAVLYTTEELRVGYLEDAARVPGVSGLPGAITGLHADWEFRDGLSLQGYAALVAGDSVERIIIPDGTRRYSVQEAVRRGSESVTVIVGDEERRLTRGTDYAFDYVLGAVTLVQPLWPRDADMNDVRLRVEYAPETARRDQVVGGLGLDWDSGDLQVQAGAAIGIDDTRAAFGVTWTDSVFTVDAQLNLTFADEVTHSGNASVAYALTSYSRVRLAHRTGTGSNRTNVSYEHDLEFAEDHGLELSAGVGYAWERAHFSVTAGADYWYGRLRAGLDHEQGLHADERSTSTATVGWALNQNLTAKATAEIVWGNSFDGTIGLVQHIGNAELELSYRLPTASGGGNLARFGVRAPFRLSDELSLDVHAGVSRAFSEETTETGGGAALRYRNDGLVATLGSEVAYDGDFKLVFRAGASGQLGKDQNLAFDANYQVLPEVEGRLRSEEHTSELQS